MLVTEAGRARIMGSQTQQGEFNKLCVCQVPLTLSYYPGLEQIGANIISSPDACQILYFSLTSVEMG